MLDTVSLGGCHDRDRFERVWNIPAAHKFDTHLAGESLLEKLCLCVRFLTSARINSVRETYFFKIASWNESHTMEHASKSSSSVRALVEGLSVDCEYLTGLPTTREAKEANLVSISIVVHEELITTRDVMVEIPCKSFVGKFGTPFSHWCHEPCGRIKFRGLQKREIMGTWVCICSDTSLIVTHLAVLDGFFEQAEELDDVGVLDD